MTHIVSPGDHWHPSLGPANNATLALAAASVGRFEAHLARWACDAALTEQAEARRHRHWLAQAASETATFDGVLADLGERGATITIVLAGGDQVRGTVRALGADFVLLALSGGPAALVFVNRAQLLAVRTLPGERPSAGTQVLNLDARLLDVLAELVAERPRVQIVGAPDVPAGELRAVGHDVLTVRTDGSPPATVYVPAAAAPALIVN
jgi:hypothetical protein